MLHKLLPVFAALSVALYAPLTVATASDFVAPYLKGGYQLASPGDGYGQPLNVIISSNSDPRVLQEDGFLFWAKSIGLSQDCLKHDQSTAFTADLGDGRGWQKQVLELTGSCFKDYIGGTHLRVFPQLGGAIFIAAVNEDSDRNPVTNGYDVARDKFAGVAANGSTYDGIQFNVTSVNVTGLLNSGTVMNNTAVLDHGVSTDGIVKLLTINVTSS